MLVDQIEPARSLSSDEGAQRLDVLPLAPGRAGDRVARLFRGDARRRGIALGHGEQRGARVRHRERLVGVQRRREALLGADTERQQLVHAFLEALGRDGRRGRDG